MLTCSCDYDSGKYGDLQRDFCRASNGITGATISVAPALIVNSTRENSVRIQLPLDRGLFASAVFFCEILDRTLVVRREGVQ